MTPLKSDHMNYFFGDTVRVVGGSVTLINMKEIKTDRVDL